MLNIEGDDATQSAGRGAEEDLVEMDKQLFRESLPAESDMLFGYATLERETSRGGTPARVLGSSRHSWTSFAR